MSSGKCKEHTIDYVKSRLSYDPETGGISWASVDPRSGNKVGDKAGTILKVRGGLKYLSVRLQRVPYLGHRLAWAIHYGVWPSGQIDHANGNGLDNRIENLRDVSASVNHRNSKIPSDNKSEVIGVYKHAKTGKWAATIRVDGKSLWIGYYERIEEAAAARKAAEEKFGFHLNHGLTKAERETR